MDQIKTKHIDFNGRFHFLLAEKIWATIFFVWLVIILGVLYLFLKFVLNNFFPLMMILSFIFIALFTIAIILYFYIWPAYSRGKFLRNKGYCLITKNGIEANCMGTTEYYEYKGRSIKVKNYKDGSADIFIGKGLIDLVKHAGPVIFTEKDNKANRAARGFGAPLYRVTNADEVVSYLEANK